ncbi:hypothetical protein AGABI2DRAFT_181129 [Agaricus bisporus var. bisporus H97]|uniref:hypothetical protein n=1 Tax=Agaricus bisporus var. bisporus (strain H97 / ATCC MYA-4626 / FGSC 10389) TaxID=936046 RepID=UPI00029F7AE5|nr:hypothetical protein AGABI2DRAFT_181129 [Agaricus bisporus var. bisporus H97]EKV42852.1 hypothetical protein AGABI2DRAFT_181129 [Agaricus bisporus var. bisporus H97]
MFFARSSRQASPESPNNAPANGNSQSSARPSNHQRDNSQPSSASPAPRISRDSESYPSWLPRRPPPPAPASTMHSSNSVPEPDPDTDAELFASIGGRKPTPRSGVIPPGSRKPCRRRTDTSRPRGWSRATAPRLSAADGQGGFSYPYYTSLRIPQPKFNAKTLDLKTIVTPSFLARLYFNLFPFLAFTHLPLQTYFDFNAVFVLIEVSRYPNPEAPGVPGSGRNWALAAAAYIACWVTWIVCVFLFYELAYSFIRRWRLRRPPIMPIYLSAPAYTFASLTSYTNFRFLLYLRLEAFFGDNGSLRDGLAETFYWYSQNLPTVALLIPRAGLCLAILFAFSSPQAQTFSLANMGINNRDHTYFRRHDGTLTGYARGVLIANAAWAAWRILVLLVSWVGLWILSGQGFAGLCGPRYRWEEEDAEKTKSSIYSTENDSKRNIDALAWTWKECTRLRIQDVYELCLNTPALKWSSNTSPAWGKEKGKAPEEQDPVEVQRVLAAVGIPTVPAPARRRGLTEDFFDTPKEERNIQLRHRDSDKGIGPSTLPYPFNQHGSAQVSSQGFPSSPSKSKSKHSTPISGRSHVSNESTSSTSSTGSSSSGSTENDTGEDEEEEEDGFDESEEVLSTSGHGSNSMSSLGHPITPSRRYPFSLRQPTGRGNSTSSRSHQSRPSQSGVSQSGVSYSGISQSTGNRPSTDSPSSPSDAMSSSSSRARALSQGSGGSGIPMPPRHPHAQTRSMRPPSMALPPVPSDAAVEFPSIRIRADSGILPGVTTMGAELMMHDDGESVYSNESASDEQQDEVGLLSPVGSHTNLGVPASGVSGSGSSRSRTGSSARSRNNSNRSQRSSNPAMRSRVSSIGVIVRSRAQSLMQSVSATSLEIAQSVTRMRTNSSMARLEEETVAHHLPELSVSTSAVWSSRPRDASGSTQESNGVSISSPQAWEDRGYVSASSHSRSGSGSGGENWTFGQPMPFMRPGNSHLREEVLSSDSERGGVREEGEIEEVTHEFGPTTTRIIHPQTLTGPGVPGITQLSASFDTVSVGGGSSTTRPRTRSSIPSQIPLEVGLLGTESRTSGNTNVDSIPWGRYRLQEPYAMGAMRGHRHSSGYGPGMGPGPVDERSMSSSSSPRRVVTVGHSTSTGTASAPDVSTAAQSFVTSPGTGGGTTTTTESSEKAE